MSEHELTEEKIEELWDAYEYKTTLHPLHWRVVPDCRKESQINIARAAYDLGKRAATDDGFIPCEFEDIRKGDTVERTVTYEDGAVEVITGEADYHDSNGDWYTRHSIELTDGFFHDDATYRRKPAKVTPPDPEKHPIILDGDGEVWVRDGAVYVRPTNRFTAFTPDNFGNDWTPAKVVAKEDD